MLEKSLTDKEWQDQSGPAFLSSRLFEEKTDPFLIVLIIFCSVILLAVSFKLGIFHLWADFLRSTLILRLMTYPLLVSAVIVVGGVIFRTVI